MAKYIDSHGCTLNTIYPMPRPVFYDEVEENEKAPCIWSEDEADMEDWEWE